MTIFCGFTEVVIEEGRSVVIVKTKVYTGNFFMYTGQFTTHVQYC